MLKQMFLWCVGRFESTLKANERKIVIGQHAAYAMIHYLYGFRITTINAAVASQDGSNDTVLVRPPEDMDDLMRLTRCVLLANAAEQMMVEVGKELLNRTPLKGFCDDNGRLLGPGDDIIGWADERIQRIMIDEDLSSDKRAWLISILAKRTIAHYYLAIVNLAAELIKQPLVIGEQACGNLFRDCVRCGPVNSVPLECVDVEKERLWLEQAKERAQNRA